MKELRIFKVFLKPEAKDPAHLELVEKIQKRFRKEEINYEYWRGYCFRRKYDYLICAIVDTDEKISMALLIMDALQKAKWGKKNIAIVIDEEIDTYLPEHISNAYSFFIKELKKTD